MMGDKNIVQGSGFLGDGFVNEILNLGYGSEAPISQTKYKRNTDLSFDRETLDAMLRESWITSRAVAVVAEDMVRERINIQCPDMTPDDIERVEREFARLDVWADLEEAIMWGRLYGGAALIPMIDGHDLSTPLRPANVQLGTFKGLYVIDRWTLWPDVHDLVTDFGPDFGLPRYYKIATGENNGIDNQRVHHSRVFRFIGNKLPHWQKIQQLYWGQSIMETIFDRMCLFDATTFGAAQLIAKAYLKVHKIPDLTNMLAGAQDAQDALMKKVLFMNYVSSSMATVLIDGEEEMQFSSYTFAGLPDVLVHMGEQLSGALGVPTTRLFGQSPKGMSATGESDIKGYYDTIGSKQEKDLRYPLNRIMEILFPSLFGLPLPVSFGFKFNSLWKLSDTEMSDIASKDLTGIVAAVDSGVYTPDMALAEIRQLSQTSGRGSTVTDEDIERAKNVAPGVPDETEEMPEADEYLYPNSAASNAYYSAGV